jgi:hypothetical protein
MKTERMFNFNGKDYPYIDATEDIPFVVNEKDISGAKQSDPNHCVAACAVKRQYSTAFFRRDTAVVLAFDNGIPVARRYRFSTPLRLEIKKFDSTGIFIPGTYSLKAPTISQTLDAKKENSKKNRAQPKSKRNVSSRRTYMMARANTPAISSNIIQNK